MAEKIGQAGLPDRCVTHGLRKAAARRLAEAGCSANEIASITGHVTLEEVARYTKAAEQKKLARAAMARLAGEKAAEGKFPNLPARFGKNGEKDKEIKVELAGWRPVGAHYRAASTSQYIDPKGFFWCDWPDLLPNLLPHGPAEVRCRRVRRVLWSNAAATEELPAEVHPAQ